MSKVVSSIKSPWLAKEPPVLRWKVQCSTFVNGDWSSWRSGFLTLRPLAQRLVLLNEEEILIDAHFLLENEAISKGNLIELPVHKVIIGDQIITSSDQNSARIIETRVAEYSLKSSDQELQVSPPQFNFARGIQFAADIFKKFGHSINFSPGFCKRPFFLVAAFGRSNFKLDVHTVSVSLEACFGGKASHFQVSLLHGRVFKFAVASRSIGFEIYNSGKISEKDFVLHFLLWGKGGPNWEFEERKYYSEQDAEWTYVQRSKSKAFGKISVFDHLSFPPKMEPITPLPNSSISGNSNKFMSIKRDNADNERKSYAQVVNGGNRITDQINCKSMPPSIYSNGREIWVPKKAKSLPLPGLIPFMRFATFLAPDPNNWPDSSCHTWFKARGPVKPVRVFSTFKELFSFSGSSQSPNSPAFSPSRGTVNPSSSTSSTAAPTKFSAMANIPIDPQLFVHRGFIFSTLKAELRLIGWFCLAALAAMRSSPLQQFTQCRKVRFSLLMFAMFLKISWPMLLGLELEMCRNARLVRRMCALHTSETEIG
jgi:hypothetical protein